MHNSYGMDFYKIIFNILYEEHSKHTGVWLGNKQGRHYNLKKVLVDHICSTDPDNIEGFIDEQFLNYMDNYKTSLTILYSKILHRVKKETNVEITGRIKSGDAIILKLHRKRFEDDGKFPLNKYLNDLLGFRIIDDNFGNNIYEIPLQLNDLKTQNKRIIHKMRENGEYSGYHVYFMGANSSYFPMELQIWNSKNARKNFESHEMYKKEYTYWPQIYNKG